MTDHRHRTQRPQPHLVVFRDQSAGLRYLSRSTRTSEHSTTWEDGNIYPVIEVDLSSAAHLARTERAGREGEQAGRSLVGAGA
jgi:large subunit ribosomal protein L31